MPGETTTNPTANLGESAENTGRSTSFLSNAIESIGNLANLASGPVDKVTSEMQKMGISLDNTTKLTEAQALAFAGLSATFLGAEKFFKEGGAGLNLFTNQLNDTIDIALRAKEPFSALGNIAGALGMKLDIKNTKEGIVEAAGEIKKFALNIFESADAHTILQNKIIQTAAASGELNEIFSKAGTNLNNINAVSSEYGKMLINVREVTHMTSEEVGKYYSELGKIPGAMSNTIGGTNPLVAAIQMAKGTGQETSDVIKGLSEAYKLLGLSGDGAAKFVLRMSEVSNKFTVDLSAVQTSLNQTAGLFSKIGTENQAASTIMEGATRIVNNYMQALKDTGVSGVTALGIIHDMTAQVTNLTTAQKAFLSSQSGGPGGLRGAFDIEYKMKEGKVDEVFEDVRKTMMKQFGGKIVSVEEARQDEGAAQQLTRQRLMLQQGPLGQFAKTDQDAGRILEMFNEVSSGKRSATGLGESIIQDTMKKGADLQDKSYTALNKIQTDIAAIRARADTINLGAIQAAATVGVGTTQYVGQRSEAKERASAYLSDTANASSRRAAESARTSYRLTSDTQPGVSESQAIKNVVDSFKILPDYLTGIKDTFINAFKGGKIEDLEKQRENIHSRIEAKREESQREKDPNEKVRKEREVRQAESALHDVDVAIDVQKRKTQRKELQEADAASHGEDAWKYSAYKDKKTYEDATRMSRMPPKAYTAASAAAVASGTVAPGSAQGPAPVPVPSPTQSTAQSSAANILSQFKEVSSTAPKQMQEPIEQLKQAIVYGSRKDVSTAETKIQSLVERKEKELSSTKINDEKRSEISRELERYKETQRNVLEVAQMAQTPQETTKTKQTASSAEAAKIKPFPDQYYFKEPAKSPNEEKSEEKPVATALRIPPTDRRASPAAAVESVAATNASAQSTAAAAKAEPTAVAAGKTAPEVLQVHVNIDGICPHCRNLIHGDHQEGPLNPANPSPIA